MTPSSPFEILRTKKVLNWSGKYTSAALTAAGGLASGVPALNGTETAPRGFALGSHATDESALDLAQGSTFKGFLTRRVMVGGAQLADRIFGVINGVPVGVEYPFPDGYEVTVERGQTVEAEGAAYILTSGTGLINGSTAVGTPISFKNGKFYVSQSGDNIYFTLDANNLTASDGSSLRIRVEAAD